MAAAPPTSTGPPPQPGHALGGRVAGAVLAGWGNRLVTIALNLLLIPVLFRNMPQEELGLWFLLGQTGAFLGLMDFGFTPTLVRRVALAVGGLQRDGEARVTPDEQLRDLIATARIVYRGLGVLLFATTWLSGWLVLRPFADASSYQELWLAWTLLCASNAVAVWSSTWPTILAASGAVGWTTLIGTAVVVLTLGAQVAVGLAGGGLVGLAAASAAGALLGRAAMIAAVRRGWPEALRERGRFRLEVVRAMAPAALRAWLTALGAFLIFKTDQYFIASFLGTAEIPPYQAAYQVASNVNLLALSAALSTTVFISQRWQAGDLPGVHRLVERSVRLGMAVMLLGAGTLFVAGEDLMHVWLGPGRFVGYGVLAIFCVMLTLEAHHGILAAAGRATEDEAYVPWAVAAGLLNLGFTWFLVQRHGLVGVAAGTLLAQLCTNNWYAVYRPLKRLQLSARRHFARSLAPLLGAAAALVALLWLVRERLLSGTPALPRLLALLLTGGAALAATLWWGVLSAEERRAIAGRLSGRRSPS